MYGEKFLEKSLAMIIQRSVSSNKHGVEARSGSAEEIKTRPF